MATLVRFHSRSLATRRRLEKINMWEASSFVKTANGCLSVPCAWPAGPAQVWGDLRPGKGLGD